MFYYGIKFHGISHENINIFIKEILDIKQNNILNSHFYTDDLGDFEYSDKTDLSAVCQGNEETENWLSVYNEMFPEENE